MKRNILLLTALFIFGTLFAQEDSQNAVVSVENDYNPTIVTVNKKSFTPTVESKSQAKPAELIFSKQTTPYTGFVSEKNTKELLPAQERPLPGYLRVGYGIRNDIDAKLAYNLNFGTKSYLRVLGAFDGFKSNINGVSGQMEFTYVQHRCHCRFCIQVQETYIQYRRRFQQQSVQLPESKQGGCIEQSAPHELQR